MNLATGAPTPVSFNFGPWGHFIWVTALVIAIFFICWFIWTKVCSLIPEPFRTVLWVLGLIAMALLFIFLVLIPLMGVF
jgi:hypothetical protein